MSKGSETLSRIVRRFRASTVGVLGDFMIDELLRGEATRISPEAPVPVVLITNPGVAEGFFPGGAGNVAANVAALGGRAIPFGVIGRDKSGEKLSSLLRQRGISAVTLVKEDGRVTPRKVRIVAHQHQLLRLDYENPVAIGPRATHALLRRFASMVGQLQGLIVSDYHKGTVTTELYGQIVALARRRHLPIFVDPKPENKEICRDATLVTPNLREAELMAGVPLRDPRQRALGGRRLMAELGCQNMLITRGAEGMTLFEASGEVREIPSVPRPVYDVTGAGDTVIAVLALAMSVGGNLKDAAELANAAGGRVVLKFGTSVISFQELLQAVAGAEPFR
ncbi:MAG: bifunctional hydroxymethylpyrimidine kinase/phosphomethylpyrimidine kinase [Acidobacteria bacterium]|nr:bifunctional hydroxymethylpyrimidine kinase/phosphomethylpyrimidine kinase [Acidobacteriota bacterium]